MNSKMTTNSQLLTTEPKKKKTKTKTRQTRTGQNHRNGDHMEGGEREGENGGKGAGNKKHKWQVQKRQGEGMNSVGNGEAKDVICVTHGHELWGGWGDAEG